MREIPWVFTWGCLQLLISVVHCTESGEATHKCSGVASQLSSNTGAAERYIGPSHVKIAFCWHTWYAVPLPGGSHHIATITSIVSGKRSITALHSYSLSIYQHCSIVDTNAMFPTHTRYVCKLIHNVQDLLT